MQNPTLGLDINATIAILNLICIMNHDQFHHIFVKKAYSDRLLEFLKDVLELSGCKFTTKS
jgi:hypothetical protein